MRFLKSGLILSALALSTSAFAQSIAEMGEQAKDMVAEIKSINQETRVKCLLSCFPDSSKNKQVQAIDR